MLVTEIAAILRTTRMPYNSERELQDAIEATLKLRGVPYLREHRLDGMSRPDFVCSGVVIEVKVKGAARDTHRQVKRYCKHPAVTAVVLVTGKTIGMPAEVEGKPVVVVSTGRAWL